MDGPPDPKPHWNPYLAGVLLGLVLLVSFVVLGAGLGASAGLARGAAACEALLLPGHVAESAYFGQWFPNPLRYYLVFMLLGVVIGGGLSALLARRIRWQVERGAKASPRLRLILAAIGGVIVGFASPLAAGCTSGQALSGGAMLLTGSLLFMGALFASGYATAWFVRRQWHD